MNCIHRLLKESMTAAVGQIPRFTERILVLSCFRVCYCSANEIYSTVCRSMQKW